MEPSPDWPEPIVRVQSLSESCRDTIPDRYIKPPEARPATLSSTTATSSDANIPLVNLEGLYGPDAALRQDTRRRVSEACREWGFFQITNHGVRPDLMDRAQHVWREFFHLPMPLKQPYANSPKTYEGYGSRLGVEKAAVLDWSDYYYLHYLPSELRDLRKWPALPADLREVIAEYSSEIVRLGGELLKVFSVNLGLREDSLQTAFGGEEIGACLRVNFYPKCPQPDLALGLSSHSDPGGMTFLLPDPDVPGLQVRRPDGWVTVKPVPHAFIVNIGDQIQILSNAIYKSVEHRVIVNSTQERLSLAYFYNPKSNIPIQPLEEVVKPGETASYSAMTFDEYRMYIRTKGPKGKSQLGASFKCTR
ncbi:jasmonate-induced oxygenase 2-like [Andrographis paniculata]|uniref:jasmonate-induced oxygenase 2-like n=1 Tax=Andrographis paniculata TaxID=175694 RepID=UPI0021E8F69F|nr:jasmonate-induced oxygenase 2-like [Andrographis paniculata]